MGQCPLELVRLGFKQPAPETHKERKPFSNFPSHYLRILLEQGIIFFVQMAIIGIFKPVVDKNTIL